jgi:aminopeptidase N
MIDAVKASLDYFTAHFSPYQHRQVRIVEFPRYASFAQSFPNTIPYSESIGFIADLTDPDAIDYVFYVTAHEVAHQWWAHQVIGADVQGSTVLSETLAQYSALMVMEHAYGERKMHEFLRYELDRYLLGRATELEKELPLLLVENQPYIHYNKGSLAMYAMRHYVGEDAVNRALRSILAEHAFEGAPFPTSRALVDALRAVTPPEHAYLIEDLFETITLYDNRMLSAALTELPDGRFRVDMVVESHKLRADEHGNETEIPSDDWIEIGLLAADEDAPPLHLERRRLQGGTTELSLVVDERPARAGIDPNVILVDRDPDDNVRAIEP